MSKKTPFDYIRSINNKDEKLSYDDYVPFIINRGLSHGYDTILWANIMNMNAHITEIMQYDFYYHGIPARKRYNKWVKKDTQKDVDIIKKYYMCSIQVALEYAKILTEEQIAILESKMSVGGSKK